jgi:hypothetical protein
MITEKDLKNFEKWDSIIEKNESIWTEEFIELVKDGELTEYSLDQFLKFRVFVAQFQDTLIKDSVELYELNENKVLEEDEYLPYCLALFHHLIIDGKAEDHIQGYEA